MRALFLVFLLAPLSQARTEQCLELEHIGNRAGAHVCFEQLRRSGNPAERAEGLWGLHDYEESNKQFRLAVQQDPRNADYRVRWGRLFLERFNKEEAGKLFQEALAIDSKNARATLGLALIASDGFESKAVELAHKAIELDPKLLEAQELLAALALEDGDQDKAMLEADKAIAMGPNAFDALAVKASIDVLRDKKETPFFQQIFSVNPHYGNAYALTGHFLVLNRRYDEGIVYYKKAIELDPELSSARADLGVNLMRLGQAVEAKEQLAAAFESGYRNALTVNSLRLIDSYKNFVTFRTPTTIIKLDKKEADLLHPYVESELKRAIETFEKKYKLKLASPVQVELYPNHEDFAVRTLGMPGLGALGVTFDYGVAMDSPSGRKPGTFHWASTLWHELSHVYVLAATNYRVPRWFTEGLAVYEETATSPDWGDRLDPQAILAIHNKKLLPIAEMDRGFVRPSYPAQVVVSYFQAGKICDYIAETWGYGTLLDMMHSFGQSKTTPEVVEMHLKMKPEAFDTKFLAWLEAQNKRTLDGFDAWKKRRPELLAAASGGRWDDVIKEGNAVRDLYAEYVEENSVYELLAKAYAEKGDKSAAIAQLRRYSAIGGRNPPTLKLLATLLEESGQKKEAAQTLTKLNFIYPQDEELHRKLGDLLMATGETARAITEYQAVLASKPLDVASSHFNLARAYRASNRIPDARDQLLQALENAPGYRPAQRMLLEITPDK